MLAFPNPLFAMTGGTPPVIGPIDPATLFGTGVKGGVWSFNDSSTLRVNDNGAGGVPALDAAGKWVVDRGPNAKHLRNAAGGGFVRRAGGIELSTGGNYGLYNVNDAGAIHGDWVSIPEPMTILAAFRILAHSANEARILAASSPLFLVLGNNPGEIFFYSAGYGTTYTVGFNIDVIAAARLTPSARESGVGGALAPDTLGGQPFDQLYIGSGSGGGAPTPLLLKHLAIIGRALSNAEVASVAQWMAA